MFQMKNLNLVMLRKIINEELQKVKVAQVESKNSKKASSRVRKQKLSIKTKRNQSLNSLLEQNETKLSEKQIQSLVKAWMGWLKKLHVRKDSEGNRGEFLKRLAIKMGDPSKATQIKDMAITLQIQDDMGMNNTGYDLDDLISALGSLPAEIAYRKKTKVDFSDDDSGVGGRDDLEIDDINEARFVGGLGFWQSDQKHLSESEDLEECGCGSDHHVPALEISDNPSESLRDEGFIAPSQLRNITRHSQQINHLIQDAVDLPDWIEAKITKSSAYLADVFEYLDYKINGK